MTLEGAAATVNVGDGAQIYPGISGVPGDSGAGVVNFLNTDSYTFSSRLSGDLTLNMIGGPVTFASSWGAADGTITVRNGTFLVSSNYFFGRSGALVVGPAGTLAGNGGITGSLALAGTIAPGGSAVGALHTGDARFDGGATYAWKIRDAINPDQATAGWDKLSVYGSLTLGNGGAPITLRISTTGSDGQPGDAANFDPSQSYTWTILESDHGIDGFDPERFVVDASAFTNSYDGTFVVRQSGNSLVLVYEPVPQPYVPVPPGPQPQRPVIKLVGPAQNFVTAGIPHITGRASDPDGTVVKVLASVNGSRFTAVKGTRSWDFQPRKLRTGKNVIRILATDDDGLHSKSLRIEVTYIGSFSPN